MKKVSDFQVGQRVSIRDYGGVAGHYGFGSVDGSDTDYVVVCVDHDSQLYNFEDDLVFCLPSELRKVRKVVTAQGIFDHVWKFMAKQGAPAVSRSGCVYRAECDGKVLACAAGCLLSDEEAAQLMAKIPLVGLDSWVALTEHGHTPARFAPFLLLIRKLQQAHDLASTNPQHFLELFQENARGVAKAFNLTVPQ